MSTKRCLTTTLLSLSLTMGMAGWATAQAAEPSKPADAPAPAKKEWLLPTGEHWAKGTEQERKAYILGILNLAMVEYQLSGPNPKHRTTVTPLVKALDGMTVSQIAAKVDGYYKANPDQQNRPIIQVIWSEMVAQKTDANAEKPSAPTAKK